MTTLNVSLPYVNTTLSGPQANFTKLVTNSLQSQSLPAANYLGPWLIGTLYNAGEFVIYSNQLFKCLVTHTATALNTPNASNPAQAEWVVMTSNNAIKNDSKTLQVSQVSGNDAKAAAGYPVPFATVQAAANYISGPGYTIQLIDSASTWSFTTPLDIRNKTDITIDGGLTGVYERTGNTLAIGAVSGTTAALTNFINVTNLTIKNVILSYGASTATTSWLFYGFQCKNVTLDNVVFETLDNNISNDIRFEFVPLDFGDFIINNCRSKSQSNNAWTNISFGGGAATGGVPSRFFLLNHIGPVGLAGTNMGSPTVITNNADNFNVYIYNCEKYFVDPDIFRNHQLGNHTYMDVTIMNQFNSSASAAVSTNNKLTMINCSLYNPDSNSYSVLNKFGDCPYLFQGFDYDRSVSTNTIAGTGTDVSQGPMAYSNTPATFAAYPTTTALVLNTVTYLPLGAFTADSMGTVSVNTTDQITINSTGFYMFDIVLITNTVSATTDAYACPIFIAAVGTAVIATSNVQSFNTPLVSNTVTYPTARTNNILIMGEFTRATTWQVFCCNTGTPNIDARIESLRITRLR